MPSGKRNSKTANSMGLIFFTVRLDLGSTRAFCCTARSRMNASRSYLCITLFPFLRAFLRLHTIRHHHHNTPYIDINWWVWLACHFSPFLKTIELRRMKGSTYDGAVDKSSSNNRSVLQMKNTFLMLKTGLICLALVVLMAGRPVEKKLVVLEIFKIR